MCGGRERTRRVAVASSDGTSIDRHLGQSPAFRIYEVGPEGGPRLIEVRPIPARLDRHVAEGLAAMLSDVDVVLAGRAGPGASRLLEAAGVQVFAVEGPVEQALGALSRRGAVLDAPAALRAGPGARDGEKPGACDPGGCGCDPAGCDPTGGGCGGGCR